MHHAVKQFAMSLRAVLLALALSLLAAQAAAAAPELVTNGSFEQPQLPDGEQFRTVAAGHAAAELPGWTVAVDNVDILSSHWQAALGNQSLDLSGNPGIGGVKQAIATKAGAKYRIRYSMAANPPLECGGGAQKTMDVSWNGTVVKHDTFIAADDATAQDMGWAPRELKLNATAATTELLFQNTTADGGCGPTIDDVSVMELPVPAPTGAPTLTHSGGLHVGTILKAGNGSWANAPTSFAHRWQRCDPGPANCKYIRNSGAAVPFSSSDVNDPFQSGLHGATTYTTSNLDKGKVIRVKVWASNANGRSTQPAQADISTALSTPEPLAAFTDSFGTANPVEVTGAGPVYANWNPHAGAKRKTGLSPKPIPDRPGKKLKYFTLTKARKDVEQLATGTHPRFKGKQGWVSLKESPVGIEKIDSKNPFAAAKSRKAGDIADTQFPAQLPPNRITSPGTPLDATVLYYDPVKNCGTNNATLKNALKPALDKPFKEAEAIFRHKRFAACLTLIKENHTTKVKGPIFRGTVSTGDVLKLKVELPKAAKLTECKYSALKVLAGKPWEDSAPGRGDGAQSLFEDTRKGTDCELVPKWERNRDATVRTVKTVLPPAKKGQPGTIVVLEPQQADLALYLEPASSTSRMTFDRNWQMTASPQPLTNGFNVVVDDKAIQYEYNAAKQQFERRDGLGGAQVDVYFDPKNAKHKTVELAHETTRAGSGGRAGLFTVKVKEPGTVRIEAVWYGADRVRLEGWTSFQVVDRPAGSCFTSHRGRQWQLKSAGWVAVESCGAAKVRAAAADPSLAEFVKIMKLLYTVYTGPFAGHVLLPDSAFVGNTPAQVLENIYRLTGQQAMQVAVGAPLSADPDVPTIGDSKLIISGIDSKFLANSATAGANLGGDRTGLVAGGQLIGEAGTNLIGEAGTNVIASGSGNVIASGSGNVIASGSGNVIASGSGNVIASGSGNIVQTGGGAVIASGSANVIASGSANIIASGSGNFVQR